MTYRVVITRRAEQNIQDAARWWTAERSVEQAVRWLAGLDERLQSLAHEPTRCALAAESEQVPYKIRELHFGLGRRPTHRSVFMIADELVLVLAVRHVAQDSLHPDDLA